MSYPDPLYEPILLCDKCGEEVYIKLIGDEVYPWCDEDGCMEGSTHEAEAEL